MQRLLSGSASFDVGSEDINDVFAALGDGEATIQLNSTLGPPTFDAATGARPVDASVFCFESKGTFSERHMNVLRYDRKLEQFRGTSFPCFTGFYP
jgi:hypothetical protein